MKNKKGFTLIELLAVIVILAIIALIATPIIIGVIDQARKKAFENTAYGVLEGLKLNYTKRILTGTTSEKVIMEDYTEENCKIDGTSGGGEVTDKVVDGTAIYFDPKLGKKCDTYTEANSATGIKEGCMKWYTFGGNNDGETVNLLLDHNTTALVAWNTSNSNSDSSQINQKVANDTTGWVGSPRLIIAGEIAEITGNSNVEKFKNGTAVATDCFYFQDNFQISPNLSQGTATYKWLFDRTNECTNYGCDIADNSTWGYWTSTVVSDSLSLVWIVTYDGYLSGGIASGSSTRGVRPVITVSKSLIL